MNRQKRPYSVQKRPTKKKNRFIYYVKFRHPDTEEYMTAVSSGMTTKTQAMNWADEQLKKGIHFLNRKNNLSIEEFSREIWNYDISPYIQGRLKRGFSIGRSYADVCTININKHFLPYFKGRKLTSIKPSEIDKWVLMLSATSISSSTVNRVLSAVRVIFKEALRLNYIHLDFSKVLKPLKEDRQSRGILTTAEVKTLFNPQTLDNVWKCDSQIMIANMLAATTGMRSGEIRGLKTRYIFPDRVEVQFAWAQKYGLKKPKWDSDRIIPIPNSMYEIINRYIRTRKLNDPEDLVFSCSDDKRHPVTKEELNTGLYNALDRIKISDQIRRERRISFHSWRHFFNTYCRSACIPDSKIRTLTGHKTEEMTENYTHFRVDDYHEVLSLQEKLLLN